MQTLQSGLILNSHQMMKSVYNLGQLVTMLGLQYIKIQGCVCVQCTAVRHAMYHQPRVEAALPNENWQIWGH